MTFNFSLYSKYFDELDNLFVTLDSAQRDNASMVLFEFRYREYMAYERFRWQCMTRAHTHK